MYTYKPYSYLISTWSFMPTLAYLVLYTWNTHYKGAQQAAFGWVFMPWIDKWKLANEIATTLSFLITYSAHLQC